MTAPSIRRHLRAPSLEARTAWPYLPLIAAGAYSLALLANLSGIVGWVYQSSDSAATPVIAALLHEAPPDRLVWVGNYPAYESIWYLLATRNFPHYRAVWEAGPLLWSGAAVALLGWSAWRLFGRWALGVVVAAVICLGPFGRQTVISVNAHGPTLVHVVILGCVLVWLALHAERLAMWQLALAAAVLGTFTALGVGSDRLLTPAGLVPFVVAGLALAWRLAGRARARVGGFVVVSAAIALELGSVFKHAGEAAHIGPQNFPLQFLAPDAIVGRVQSYLQGLPYLAGGDPWGLPIAKDGDLRLATAVLVIAALALVVRALLGQLRTWGRASDGSGAAPDAMAAPQATYVIFWGLALATTSASYILSNVNADLPSSRYLLIAFVAVGALLPVVALRSAIARVAVVAGVTLFATIATYQLVRQPVPPGASPTHPDANALIAWAKSNGVKKGFTGYWTAASVTWQSHLELRLFAVLACPPAGTFCPHPVNRITTWYRPQPGQRTMYVANSAYHDPLPDRARYGRPVAVRTFGQLTAYLYGYDIAGRLGPG